MENNNSLYRYEAEIFQIQIGDSNVPMKWNKGSKTYVPGVGDVTVTRIYLDIDGYNLNGVSRIIVMAAPDSNLKYEYVLRSYPAHFCSITNDGVSELTRLGYFDPIDSSEE